MSKLGVAVCLITGLATSLIGPTSNAQQDPFAEPPAPAPTPAPAPAPQQDPFAEPPAAAPEPPADEAPAYPPPRLAEPMAARPRGPRVILRSDDPNPRLQRLSRIKWEDVCLTPCGVSVDPRGVYRIGGGAVRKTEPFRLPASSGDVVIDVEAGSNVKHFVGLGLMIGGVVSLGYAAASYLLFQSVADNSYTTTGANSAHDTAVTFSLVLAVVGAVLEGVGIPLWNSNTTIHIH